MSTSRTQRLRTLKEWTQPQMAAYLGISQSQVSRLETGASEVGGAVARLLDLLEAELAETCAADSPAATSSATGTAP